MSAKKASKKRSKRGGKKYVYFFGGGKADGSADMKDLLGGKGANLAEMTWRRRKLCHPLWVRAWRVRSARLRTWPCNPPHA
ncbi:MAG: hypothetical protein PHE61_01120 [Candidatus Omnitrophica bacterium]|nr:hypothetical protein [Candidatus Omnitrophota bacterium]